MTQPTPAQQSNRAAPGRRELLVRMLAQCGARLQSDLGPLVDLTFQRVDDALHDLADKADSDRHHTAYVEALHLVGRERAALKRHFLRNLADGMTLFQGVRNSLAPSADWSRLDSEGLSLLDDDDLEESLVLANMVSKAENRYQRPLRQLTDLFIALMGQRTLKPETLPLSPHAIGTAVSAAVQRVPDLGLATALVFYKVFDKQVMDNLGATYDACLDIGLGLGLKPADSGHRFITLPSGPSLRRSLADARGGDAVRGAAEAAPGGSPRLNAAPGPGPAASRTPPYGAPPASPSGAATRPAVAADAAGASPDGRLALSGVAADAPVKPSFEQLRGLLHDRRPSVTPNPAVPVLDTPELLLTLSRMQQGTVLGGDQTLAPSRVRSSLVTDLDVSSSLDIGGRAGCASRRLESRDADTMDLVFLLFEQILAAPDVPDAIKVLVSRLQVPYVKLALLDRHFFDDPAHPARALLNRIAEASIGWNDDGERGRDSLFGWVRHVVERVITEFQTDPALFSVLNVELSDYLRGCEFAAKAAETRAIEIAGTREQQRRARGRVMDVIHERLRGREDIPVAVASIVYEGWADVMLKAFEQQGENSHAWRQTLRLLDRLLWSVEAKPDPAARRELLRRIPELLRRLRGHLGEVISDQRLIARWLKELQTLHIAVLRGPAAPSAGVSALDRAAGDAAESIDPASRRFDVDALPLGTWIAIARDDASWFRAKLAWRSSDGDTLMLVDRLGRKGFEMSRGDLSTLLEQELAEVIGDGSQPLVDRAMAAMRHTLGWH